MKRRQNILQCFRKIPRTELDKACVKQNGQQALDHDITTKNMNDLQNSSREVDEEVSAIPDCWSMNQFINFKQKYDGLTLRNKRLGCDYCGRFPSELVEDCNFSPMIFLDLAELEQHGAEEIYATLLNSLHLVGFDEAYLEKNLIAFCTDGASVMLGRRSGLGIKLKNNFPDIILWHCLNHRLQLVLDAAITDIKQVNHLEIFMDKIHTIFHKSNKNQMEIFKISEELGQQIAEIGRVSGSKWSACSLESALAVWHAYPALWKYFSKFTKHSGMVARLGNKYFLDDLALMIDILQELSFLSEALQARCVTLTQAEKLVLESIKAFELLIESKGTFENKITDRIASEEFKDVQLIENHKFLCLPRKKLLEEIIENMRKKLMDNGHLTSGSDDQENTEFHQVVNLLESDTWNTQEVVVPWLAAEEKLCRFTDIFHYEIPVNDFRDYVKNVLQNFKNPVIPRSVQKAKAIVSTIAVSSAELERGFSSMNHICSDKSLVVENIANLMTINLIGLPFEIWDAAPYAKTWLRNHVADDQKLQQRVVQEYDCNQVAIWNLLK
ncbi:E3 SUMO-protein ligase KIAA1586-like [Styela clava]